MRTANVNVPGLIPGQFQALGACFQGGVPDLCKRV
jgi:hypothetical protein